MSEATLSIHLVMVPLKHIMMLDFILSFVFLGFGIDLIGFIWFDIAINNDVVDHSWEQILKSSPGLLDSALDLSLLLYATASIAISDIIINGIIVLEIDLVILRELLRWVRNSGLLVNAFIFFTLKPHHRSLNRVGWSSK